MRPVQKKEAAVNEKGELSESELWDVYSQAVEDLGDAESANRCAAIILLSWRPIFSQGKGPLMCEPLDDC